MQRFVREAAHVDDRLGSPLTARPRSSSRARRSPVSSHVIHVPHGVTPPAQLRIVPARLDQARTHGPASRVEDQVGRAAGAVVA